VGYRAYGDQLKIADPAYGGSTYWMTTHALAGRGYAG